MFAMVLEESSCIGVLDAISAFMGRAKNIINS